MRNVALLEATMTQIKDHPELHRQDVVFADTDCGTAACFAGWACLLDGYMRVSDSVVRVETPNGTVSGTIAAASALGISDEESWTLFSAGNSRPMLELMVKDLVNGEELQDKSYYEDLADE